MLNPLFKYSFKDSNLKAGDKEFLWNKYVLKYEHTHHIHSDVSCGMSSPALGNFVD